MTAAMVPGMVPGGAVVALEFGPFDWVGGIVQDTALDTWRSAMIALWSGGLWMLRGTFSIIDMFSTPDLSSGGPLGQVLPITMGIAAAMVAVLAVVQLTAALVRRDFASLGQLVVGTMQFAAAWAGYLAVVAAVVAGVHGLTQALLQATLGVSDFAAIDVEASWPRDVTDAVLATVLGLLTLFLIFPAAIALVVMMLTRFAALIVLAAVSPITAAGLVAESTKRWFWVANRWFLSAVFMPALCALVLGVGVRMMAAVLTEGGGAQSIPAAVGSAIVGCVVVLLAAVCPLALFKLLAFVDPGTSSGAAFRSTLGAAGGWSGFMGSTAAGAQTPAGQAQGEADAETAAGSRINAALGAVGQLNNQVLGAARTVAGVGADELTMAGVGAQAPFYTDSTGRPRPSASTSPTDNSGGGDDGSSDAGGGAGGGVEPSTDVGAASGDVFTASAGTKPGGGLDTGAALAPPAPPGGWDGPSGGGWDEDDDDGSGGSGGSGGAGPKGAGSPAGSGSGPAAAGGSDELLVAAL